MTKSEQESLDSSESNSSKEEEKKSNHKQKKSKTKSKKKKIKSSKTNKKEKSVTKEYEDSENESNSDIHENRYYTKKNFKYKRLYPEKKNQNFINKKADKIYISYHLYFLPKMIEYFKKKSKHFLKDIQRKTGCENLYIDSEKELPDLIGKVISISDKRMSRKQDAFYYLMDLYEDYLKEYETKNKKWQSLIILIPEALVSLFIGYKGRNVKNLMKSFRTKIIVNQPVQNFPFRCVEIDGYLQDIKDTCIECFYSLQNLARKSKVQHLKVNPKTPNIISLNTIAKFIINEKILLANNKQFEKFLNELENELNIKIKIYRDYKLKFVKENEKILQIKGPFPKVQKASSVIISKIKEYTETDFSINFDKIFMIIPTTLVNKIIGIGGCMIREIAAKSAGAQIKILSSKYKDRKNKLDQCPLSIAGSLANKQDAVSIILEKIEIFKGGGPMLTSGKDLGANSVAQYKNSIQAKQTEEGLLVKRNYSQTELDEQNNKKSKILKFRRNNEWKNNK